jgi:hypothetical protein
MASIEDLLSVVQNLVIAVNGVAQTLHDSDGQASIENITAATLVHAGRGRIVRVSVTTAGSTVGSVYDCASLTLAAAATLMATIPNVVGVYEFRLPYDFGLVVTPGTSQVVCVSYS